MDMPPLPRALLSRVEDAGLNASAPPQQRWIDGWMLRFSPGKAKRARCVNALARGHLGLDQKLALCRAVFDEAKLPLVVRITPFSEPPDLDRRLAAHGMHAIDDTRVMVCPTLQAVEPEPWPDGVSLQRLSNAAFAQTVGQLRGSPIAQQQAHAQRLDLSPVPFEGWLLKRVDDGAVLACGQIAVEADMVGIYDVFTSVPERGRGLSRRLCAHLLARSREHGARIAYLQVDAANDPARAVYRRLGFADGYAYHYRTPTLPAEDGPA
jgi:ribosomal protein S18 acetylase RimI-like enzyme